MRGGWIRRGIVALKQELVTLYYAYRDPRVPWYSRALLFLTLAYALSPLDLIPDFIPVLGLLDDLLILPLGIYLSLRSVPGPVLAECRERARKPIDDPRLRRIGLVVVIGAWAVLLAVAAFLILRSMRLP